MDFLLPVFIVAAFLLGLFIFFGKRNMKEGILNNIISKSDKILLVCIVLIFLAAAYFALG